MQNNIQNNNIENNIQNNIFLTEFNPIQNYSSDDESIN